MIHAGEHEGFKAGYHAVLGALVLGAGLYNARAFTVRRKPHLARNAIVYTVLAVWEYVKVQHHLEDR